MNISRNSWHYRLLQSWDSFDPAPRNLCPYARRVAFVLLAFFTFGVLVTVMSGFAMFAVAQGLAALAAYVVTGVLFQEVIITLIVLAVILPMIHVLFMKELGKYYRFITIPDRALAKLLKRDVDTPKCKEPGLLSAYLKARHEKICPYLEFND